MSFLSVVKSKFGLNPTATDNFVIESTGAGTGRIRKGDLSTVGGDVLTWDASNQVALPANTTNKLVAASGSAPVYGCRAWCTFNGTTTGTNAPISGGNVTSVTRSSAGNYTINFTVAMTDANYAVIPSIGGTAGIWEIRGADGTFRTTSSCSVVVVNDGSVGTAGDPTYVSIAVFA